MKKIIIIIVVPVAIAVVVVGAVWFLKVKNQKSESSAGSNLTTEEEKQEAVPLHLSQFANDQDRDGIPDEEEKKLGTSNRDFDTDGDGLSDKTEIEKWKTDPVKPDTDGDGYWDGFEIINGYNPLGTGKLVQ